MRKQLHEEDHSLFGGLEVDPCLQSLKCRHDFQINSKLIYLSNLYSEFDILRQSSNLQELKPF
jgi:hypothetical protein